MISDKYNPRISYQNHQDIYFWTATIHDWIHLLQPDAYKDIVTGSLRTLSDRKLIQVYAFVIMPNHIHLLWRVLGLNGKESPQGSLLKFTAHQFRRQLLSETNTLSLDRFAVDSKNKQYEFWQRDPMAIRCFDLNIAKQKLTYIHNNPLTERWLLAAQPADYAYSSAQYYETGVDAFGFLNNLYEAFEAGY